MIQKLHPNMSTDDLRRRILRRNWLEDCYKNIASLTPERQLLFAMYFIYGHSMKQIAALCGVHETSIGKRLKTIIRQVERKMRRPDKSSALLMTGGGEL